MRPFARVYGGTTTHESRTSAPIVCTSTGVPTVSLPLVMRWTNRIGMRVPAGITVLPSHSASSAGAMTFITRAASAPRSGTGRPQ